MVLKICFQNVHLPQFGTGVFTSEKKKMTMTMTMTTTDNYHDINFDFYYCLSDNV